MVELSAVELRERLKEKGRRAGGEGAALVIQNENPPSVEWWEKYIFLNAISAPIENRSM